MLVTLSERKFAEQIRALKNIQDTVEEINDRCQVYANELFEFLRKNHGVSCTGMISQSGQMGTFQFQLAPIYDEQSRADRISGLAMLAPNSVSVEESDLPALCLNQITRVALEDAWFQICGPLQKCLPGEIPQLLENAALRAMRTNDLIAATPETHEDGYQFWLQRVGKKDPGTDRRKREQAEQAEIAKIEAARHASYEQFRSGGE